MKKQTIFGLIFASLSLVLGATAGAFVSKQGKEGPQQAKAEAVNGVIIVTANDSTCSDTKYYSQSGSDKTSLSYTTDLKSTNTSHFNIGQSEGNYSVTEDSANKMYNYIYRPFFIYPQESGYIGIPKATKYEITVNFTLTLTKSASGGTARAFAELFFLGYGNGKPEPVLSTGSFNTNDVQSSNSSNTYNNASNANNSIGAYTNQASSPISVSKSLDLVFYNESPVNNNVVRYQLGLFAGCNYASGKDHTTSAVVSMSITRVVKGDLVAQVGSNYYTNMISAIDGYNASANQTLKLLRDANINSATDQGRLINQSGTFNLGGFTLTTNNYPGFAVRNNANLTVQNGTIRHTNNSQPGISVASGASLTINSDATVTSSGSGCIDNNGTATVRGTLTASSGYAFNNKGTGTLNGATLTTNGTYATCVYNSGSLSIVDSTLTVKSGNKSLAITSPSALTHIYGNSSLPGGILVASGYKAQHLYLYNSSNTYSGSTISLTFDDALEAGDVPFYAYNSSYVSKISITNSLSSYLQYNYNTISRAYTVQYRQYTIGVSMTHGNYTINKNTNVTYADTVTITYTLDTGYELLNSGISAVGCNYSHNSGTKTITLTRTLSNATVTITPTLVKVYLSYDGNGHTGTNGHYGGSGYAGSRDVEYNYGDTATALLNPFVKTDYTFAGWNTKDDGTGQTYFPGDEFVITEDMTLYATWVISEYTIVDEFVTNYMHMTDYTGNGDGSCISHNGGDGYYIIAKRALVQLTESQINLFRTDSRYSSPKARYEKWAEFNNDLEYAYVDDFTHIGSSRSDIREIKQPNAELIAVIVSITALSTIGIAFLIKKRKEY